MPLGVPLESPEIALPFAFDDRLYQRPVSGVYRDAPEGGVV